MVYGSREAIAVSTEEVYESNNTVFSGDISRATARELALKVLNKVKRAYPTVENCSWMGAVCDGAYATASGFQDTLIGSLHREEVDTAFFVVLWDPPHFIDLAFSDVFHGKV